MYYILSSQGVAEQEKTAYPPKKDTAVIGMFSIEEWATVAEQFQIPYTLTLEEMASQYAKHECWDGFDMLYIRSIATKTIYGGQRSLILYLEKNFFLIFSDEPMKWKKVFDSIFEVLGEKATGNKVIFDFISKIIQLDYDIFDHLEKEILELEQALITSKKRDCVKEIISLRKRLLLLKKYYEQFLDVLEGISDNENDIWEEKTLRCFERLERKTERIYANVLTLREAVTQVRESYQAEVDINLNQTMRIFTVITTIFLPLTLIVGWYGMNFDMPEYDWKHSYAMVTGLSIGVVLAGIGYFKKKGWF